jgi:ABC-type transport system involved in multi-copper enzyme maturation permease subunit
MTTSARSHVATLTQLIRDTFRQAWASGIGGMMLAVTALCVVLCLSVSVSGDVSLHDDDEPVLFLPAPSTSTRVVTPPVPLAAGRKAPLPVVADPDLARREGIEVLGGRMTLAFGAVTFPLSRERGDAVRFLELLLASGIAGTFGLLMALVWTAGFVPAFLEPGAASVFLVKPVARWQLLLGKYLGVLAFVGVQVALFVVLTWLALGVRTRVWDTTYVWCIPLLLLEFAIFYSVSVLLAVLTRSTVACVFGSLLFWLLAWGINYGSVMARGMEDPQYLPPFALALVGLAYWISPKPIDAALILFNTLDARQHFEKPAVFTLLESGQAFSPTLSILASLAVAGVLLALSAHELEAADY